jgi:hypothetical protein
VHGQNLQSEHLKTKERRGTTAEPDRGLSKRHFLSFHNGESQWPTQKPAPQLLDHIPFMSCAHCTNLKVKSVCQGGRSGVHHWSFAQPRSLCPAETLFCLSLCLVNQMWIWRIGCQLGRRGQTLCWISTGVWLSPVISSLPMINLVLRPAPRYEFFSRRTKQGLVFGEFGWRVLCLIPRAWQLCRA